MVNQHKIITMTKLALYDKHKAAADSEANDYFRHDYIYRKNLGTRLSVGFCGLVILAIYWLRVIFIDEVDIFELYLRQYVIESILFILALMAVYSLIGTIQGTREYYLVQKRLDEYDGWMKLLERIDEGGKAPLPARADGRVRTVRRTRSVERPAESRPHPPARAKPDTRPGVKPRAAERHEPRQEAPVRRRRASSHQTSALLRVDNRGGFDSDDDPGRPIYSRGTEAPSAGTRNYADRLPPSPRERRSDGNTRMRPKYRGGQDDSTPVRLPGRREYDMDRE